MRQDQIIRLKELEEELADVFIFEADPVAWPGANMDLADMDQQTRGDRYWCKKNCTATMMVLQKVISLTEKHAVPETDDDDEDDLDKQIREAEQRAKRATNKVLERHRKAEFDKRVYGKA